MEKSLIITPTGCQYYLDNEYDRTNHWLFTDRLKRDYDTCMVVFNDFNPEQNTYDMLIRKKGLKWNMLNDICEQIKWEQYDYIGYWDDDYCTDIQSVNKSLEIARQHDLPYYQMSLTSWTVYPILEQKKNLKLSRTNFIELGVPFFRNDIFRKLLKFTNDYKSESSWGIDKVLAYYFNTPAAIIHDVSVKHMRSESSYDKTEAFKEMDYLMRDFFPKYMKKNFNYDYQYTDKLLIYGEFPKT